MITVLTKGSFERSVTKRLNPERDQGKSEATHQYYSQSNEILFGALWCVISIIPVSHQLRTLALTLPVHRYHVVLEILGQVCCHLDMITLQHEPTLLVLRSVSLRKVYCKLEGWKSQTNNFTH